MSRCLLVVLIVYYRCLEDRRMSGPVAIARCRCGPAQAQPSGGPLTRTIAVLDNTPQLDLVGGGYACWDLKEGNSSLTPSNVHVEEQAALSVFDDACCCLELYSGPPTSNIICRALPEHDIAGWTNPGHPGFEESLWAQATQSIFPMAVLQAHGELICEYHAPQLGPSGPAHLHVNLLPALEPKLNLQDAWPQALVKPTANCIFEATSILLPTDEVTRPTAHVDAMCFPLDFCNLRVIKPRRRLCNLQQGPIELSGMATLRCTATTTSP
mmetsp:Transcript_115322/g.298977  ORF Transcript_115322/g.298977 Transcript_115322/m.298977 type:complete len:269 (-) Transcript_115322:165-971(-)